MGEPGMTPLAGVPFNAWDVVTPYVGWTPPEAQVASSSPSPLPSAPDLLDKAARLMEERGKQYDANGKAERSMGKVVKAFNVITGRELSEPEGWLFMQLVKDVRLFTKPGYHQDSAEDCIAYAALKAEAKQAEA